MTDRARLVYALLRTLFAWTPAPPASRTGATLAQQQRGFVTAKRYSTCPDCLANGRPEGMRGCETCGGRGELLEDGKDAMDEPIKNPPADHRRQAAGFGGLAREAQRDQERQRDDELRRLEAQLAKPLRKVDEVAGDVLTRSVELRDRMYRHGSYAELEVALAKLRDRNEVAYREAMMVAYQPFCEEPIEPVRRVVVAVCEVLAEWIDGEIRVPVGVHVWTVDELAARSREAKDALAHGRSAWASATRAERKRMILVLAGEGLSDGKIARTFGLTRQRVQQIRAGLERLDDCEAA